MYLKVGKEMSTSTSTSTRNQEGQPSHRHRHQGGKHAPGMYRVKVHGRVSRDRSGLGVCMTLRASACMAVQIHQRLQRWYASAGQPHLIFGLALPTTLPTTLPGTI